jgi:hypothetical protein
MDGVGILMIQDEYIMVPASGGDGKLAGLIRLGVVELLLWKESSTDLMSASVKGWGSIAVRDRWCDVVNERQLVGGTNVLCFLVLVA